MKVKLFRIMLEDEAFIVAENEQKAVEAFWDRKRAGEFDLDTYINDITDVDEIDEAEDYLIQDK